MIEIPFDLLVFTNLVLGIWLLVDLYQGYKKGLILQVLSWISTLVSLFVAWLFSNPFAQTFPWFYSAKGIGVASIDAAIAFQTNRLMWILILFAAIRILLTLLSPLASIISKMPLIKQVNSWVGGVAAILFFGVKLVLLCLFLTFPFIKNGQQVIENSVLVHVEKVSIPVFEWLDATVSSNVGLQSIINHQELSPEQQNDIIEWLRELDFSTNEIMEYLDSYE